MRVLFQQRESNVWHLDSYCFLLWYLNGHNIKMCRFWIISLWRVYFDSKHSWCGICTAIFFKVIFNWPQVKNVKILPIFPYWYSCVSRNYSIRLHKNEFIYFGRLVLRHRFFCRLHSHFLLSPRYIRCCTTMFFAIFIQIIAEWLRSYSSYSPIPPMTQHSTSLLIFGTQSTSL